VIGPIVGLALIGALLWFFLFRKKKSTTQPQPPMQQSQPNVPAAYPASSPGSPPQYYDPQKPPNAVPFGVASHNSWAGPPPQSPTSQASTSPHPQQGPYGPPQGQQQWQPMPQGQQMYSPSQSPPPQQGMQAQNVQAYQQPGEVARPFSAEMDGRTYHQSVGGPPMPQQGQVQYPR
jgi:LPXTG-motif cell wall-anchored protein